MLLKSMTKAEITEACETIWERLCSGDPDIDIMNSMGIDSDAYYQLRRRMFDDKAERLQTTPPEHVYVQYVLDQTQNIRSLTDMIKQFKDSKQYNAMVGAVRVRADLYDKLIDRGQDLGVFRKTPERKEIIAGVVVTEMNSKELRGAVVGAIRDIAKLMKSHGEHDIRDVLPGELHHGPALPAEARGEPEDGSTIVLAPRGKPLGKAKAKTSRNNAHTRGRKPFVAT